MSQNNETTLDVQGMSCPSCISHINEALTDLSGVASVDVKLREGKVVVRHDDAEAPVSSLVNALREAGYESSPASRQA